MSGSPPTTSAPADTPAATTDDEVEEEKREPSPQRFPPYPPYAAEVAPPSVADAIMAGRDLRYTRKNIPEKLKRPAKPPPRPAKPKSPKATDVKLSKRAARAHARCLRRHNAVLTDRLEFMSKPLKRDIIYLWRDYGHVLPADTVARLRSMLDADEPFKPDQAYEYFINLRKSRKKAKAVCVNEVKRDVIAMVTDKRFVWARNATVAFARGIQQRLSRPGQYKLADGMARLSNIVLHDICTHMNIKKPPRCCKHPKSLFMREMADKIAVWIDEILSESEDKMLMMDYDEDDDVLHADDGYADDFLDMMGGTSGGSDAGGRAPKGHQLLQDDKGDAFKVLTSAMHKKGDVPLMAHGKFKQSYREGAEVLKKAETLHALRHPPALTEHVNNELTLTTAPPVTPDNLKPAMEDVVDIASKYLAQHAEDNKHKGNAFEVLVKSMKEKGSQLLFHKEEKGKRSYKEAAKELQEAKGLEIHYDEPNLSQEIHGKLTQTVEKDTVPEMKTEMAETVDMASKYLSGKVAKDNAKDDALKVLVKSMQGKGTDHLYDKDDKGKKSYEHAATDLENATPKGGEKEKYRDDPHLTQEIHGKLKETVDKDTPRHLQSTMAVTVDAASKYLSEKAANERKKSGATPTGDGSRKTSLGEAKPVVQATVVEKSTEGEKPAASESGIGKDRSKPLSAPVATDDHGLKAQPGPVAAASSGATSGDKPTAGESETGRDQKLKTGPVASDEPVVKKQAEPVVAGAVVAPPSDKPTGGDSGTGKDQTLRTGPVAFEEPVAKRQAEPVAAGPVVKTPVIETPGDKTTAGESGTRKDEQKLPTAPVAVADHGVKEKVEAGEKGKVGDGGIEKERRISLTGSDDKRKAGAGESKERPVEVKDSHVPRIRRSERRDFRGDSDVEDDPDRAAALAILHRELNAKGSATLYQQPHTELSHSKASQWLKQKPRRKVDKAVKDSADTARLSAKFERKLDDLVAKKTPNNLQDAMQDVIIESSRILSEYFISENYKAIVADGLISEMQKKGNEILVEEGDASETFFFAAQRLKKAESREANEPCDRIAYYLTKQLEDMVKCHSMPRKMTGTMKEHIKETADYLSEHVTKSEQDIEAYVALLGEMESTGDALLVEGNIPKSYKSCAAYLRQLTSFEDQIRKSNSTLQSSIEAKLKSIMSNVPPRGYTVAHLNKAISDSARLLVSYIMLQEERTEALNVLIEQLRKAGSNVLLRHGTIRKSCQDGADLLHGKNADQLLSAIHADPVVTRKIQIKLVNLMEGNTPDKYKNLMDDVIKDATMYLAINLLQPRLVKVCKCMKNVFVQCELWCDEILRRMTRPCCTCSRHVSAQALADLAPPGSTVRFAPGSTRAFLPGIEVSVKQCPSSHTPRAPCSAAKRTPGCLSSTTSYMMYSTSSYRPTSPGLTTASCLASIRSCESDSSSPDRSGTQPSYLTHSPSAEQEQVLSKNSEVLDKRTLPTKSDLDVAVESRFGPSTSSSTSLSVCASECADLHWRMPSTMLAQMRRRRASSPDMSSSSQHNSLHVNSPLVNQNSSACPGCSKTFPPEAKVLSNRSASPPNTRTPIVSTDDMSDWHSLMVSLMWNVQAWRDWIQENIDLALSHAAACSDCGYNEEAKKSWTAFQRRVSTEAVQWRQYNTFSRQLTLRVALRYKDKRIVSPTRSTNKTEIYRECQDQMLDIIEMFNKWTQWLTVVIKESESMIRVSRSESTVKSLHWQKFKANVEEYAAHWDRYNTHIKVCWEQKYKPLISEWLPEWKQPGPVWVMSACGAVPSGAVAAGVYDQEVIWIARTTHNCNVLPAALHPSKHCCIVYADGAVHHYTKYQVMCNADAAWVPWRAGAPLQRAVQVAPRVHAGRVLYRGAHLLGAVLAPHYRCHVVVFGRPFAFNCYELLVLSDE